MQDGKLLLPCGKEGGVCVRGVHAVSYCLFSLTVLVTEIEPSRNKAQYFILFLFTRSESTGAWTLQVQVVYYSY